MSSEELKEFLIEYNKSYGYSIDDNCLLESLVDLVIYKERKTEHRWWNDYLYIAKIDEKYIGFLWAETTGDDSIYDIGWEFHWDTLAEYEPKEIIKTIYVKK